MPRNSDRSEVRKRSLTSAGHDTSLSSLRKKVGALCFEGPSFVRGICSPTSAGWQTVRNRGELLRKRNGGRGHACDWEWSTSLHIVDTYPIAGKILLGAALREFKIAFRPTPDRSSICGEPDVSFVIPHRSAERIPLLLLTLRTIAAQRDARIECIVVEQDVRPSTRDVLPSWVKYVHDCPAKVDAPWCKSRALNVGVQAAKARTVILQDGDILVPADYARLAIEEMARGMRFINALRFVFYLRRRDTEELVYASNPSLQACVPEKVVQNVPAGSVVVDRDAFWSVGGFDERFMEWGGEDNEFWQRASTLPSHAYGYLPALHLWHPPQVGKSAGTGADGLRLLRELERVDPMDRIKYLTGIRSS